MLSLQIGIEKRNPGSLSRDQNISCICEMLFESLFSSPPVMERNLGLTVSARTVRETR